jgi:dUTP pyrophosphatase
MSTTLLVRKLSPNAITPHRATNNAPGLLLSSIEDVKIPPLQARAVPIGIAVSVPQGTYGRIAPISSIASEGCIINGGILDDDLASNVFVHLINLCTNKVMEIKSGQRVAQLIIEKIEQPGVVVVG